MGLQRRCSGLGSSVATHTQEAKAANRVCRQDTETQRGKDCADKHDEIDNVLHGGVRLLFRQATLTRTGFPGDYQFRGIAGIDLRSKRKMMQLDVRDIQSRVPLWKQEIRTRPFFMINTWIVAEIAWKLEGAGIGK